MDAARRAGRRILLAVDFLLLLGIAFLLCERPYPPAGGREEPAAQSADFIRGDANDDGGLNITDPVFALNFLFLGGERPPCLAAADADDDGELNITDPVFALNFLFLGGAAMPEPYPGPGPDPTPDFGCRGAPLPELPEVGSPGGPDRELTAAEALSWLRGRKVFSTPATHEGGLGPFFNGDSCLACHLDPAAGGAGGLDVDVIRFARAEDGVVTQLPGGPAASRHSILALPREECPEETNVIETRQTPTVFGLGLLDRVPEEAILANADPDDALTPDGVSGRARLVGPPGAERVGRFGHKAGVPSLLDFAADGLANEIGLTVDHPDTTFDVTEDADTVPDPEVTERELLDLAFFIAHLAPPARRLPEDPVALARIAEGEEIFLAAGCARCHLPELPGADGPVRAYTDFLLHEVADPGRQQVDENGVAPREFRTAPLWGFRDTGPYLHDGSAEDLNQAILKGHFGEAQAAREAYEALDPILQKPRLQAFLDSL
jgi:hypothetical protein